MTDLLADLTAAHQPPMPRGFKPGVVYSGQHPSEITTPWIGEDLQGAGPAEWEEAVAKMGVPLPAGTTLELVEARFNSAAWHRDTPDKGENHTAYTAPAWTYKFRVVFKGVRNDEDLAKLEKQARKAVRCSVSKRVSNSTMVVNLSDFQVGKTDELGGTAELLERSERALLEVAHRVHQVKPEQIVLADVGDSTEGFESSPNAARTSDLQQTEQIRVWRRVFWRWISALSILTEDLQVVSVPSNHCRIRRGKDAQGPPDDDWGLEVLTQVSDLADVNPDAYGHVSFHAPAKYAEHVTLTLKGGKVISFAHGHQVSNPDRLSHWAKAQGRREIGLSDLVVVGHFHHLRIQAYGDGQYLFLCPTADGGSSWFTPRSGERSRPGVLTFVVDEGGWRDMFVAWAS